MGCAGVGFAIYGVRKTDFDTPMLSSVCKGSRLVSSCPICVECDCAVGLSLAAARRVVPRLGCLEAGEWWWFENSRAYLYYFFIVNDCQFIVRSFASGREALKDGEVFVRCAFPYKAIVNFLIFESHLFDVFPRGFFVEGSILAQDERWRRA